jgi:hypothetical protein
MDKNTLDEAELNEILQIAQEGELKFREMSDFATIMAEKWRTKTQVSNQNDAQKDPKIQLR